MPVTHVLITSLAMTHAPDPDPLELLALKQVIRTVKALYNEPLKIVGEKDQKRFILENGALLVCSDVNEAMVYHNDVWFKAHFEFKSME